MGHVEHSGSMAHRLGFVNDAGVLHRHVVSGEGNDFRIQSNVGVVQRRSQHHLFEVTRRGMINLRCESRTSGSL